MNFCNKLNTLYQNQKKSLGYFDFYQKKILTNEHSASSKENILLNKIEKVASITVGTMLTTTGSAIALLTKRCKIKKQSFTFFQKNKQNYYTLTRK